MPSRVTVYRLTGRDKYGAPSYGKGTPYRAHISNKSTMIRGANGELVATKGTVWMATESKNVSAKDKVVLPDGSIPIILDVNGAADETGLDLYTRLDMG